MSERGRTGSDRTAWLVEVSYGSYGMASSGLVRTGLVRHECHGFYQDEAVKMSLDQFKLRQAKAKLRKQKRAEKGIGLWPPRGLAAKEDAPGAVKPAKAGHSKKRSRKALIRDLDAVFSKIVRTNSIKLYGNCPFCRKEPVAQCFHFVTRAKHSVRWDFSNSIGSCAGCNLENEYSPHKFVLFFLQKWGPDAYRELVFKSNQRAGFSRSDLELMLKKLKGDG